MTSAGRVNVTRRLPQREVLAHGIEGLERSSLSRSEGPARPALSPTRSPQEDHQMTEPSEAEIYAQYFDANGQPVRAGVQLTEDEEREFAQYFPHTTDQTVTEESA